MPNHDLLSKALEIREVAATVAEPRLRAELLAIAERFERLALGPASVTVLPAVDTHDRH